MVILDTDHLSLVQFPESAAAARTPGSSRLDGHPSEIATTIVTYEEQTRGWLAYKARAKKLTQEIKAYAKLRQDI